MEAIEWLKLRWLSSGIQSDDIVLLHSNVMRTLRLLNRNGIQPSVDIILESFIQAVGKNGTLIFPLFNLMYIRFLCLGKM